MSELHRGEDFSDLTAPDDPVGVVPGPMTDQPSTQENR